MLRLTNANASVIQGLIAQKGLKANAMQCLGYAILRLCNAKTTLQIFTANLQSLAVLRFQL